jgi:transcriptional regulator with XRE-family HTH domain
MKRLASSEKLLVQEASEAAQKAKEASKGLQIGALIKMYRSQIGMSQKYLSKRAEVPQSTISRVEKGESDVNLATLNKILAALSCDLVLVPFLLESVESIRLKQARKLAEKHIRYLRGTMSLEKQQPDSKLLEILLKEEETRLLQGPDSALWGDD